MTESQLAQFLDLKGRKIIRMEDFFSVNFNSVGISCLGYYTDEKFAYYSKRFSLDSREGAEVLFSDTDPDEYYEDSVRIYLTATRKEGQE